jgi:hypothetical protein
MIDIETLSKDVARGITTSIGACRFSMTEGIIDTFQVNIEVPSAKSVGLITDQETVDWWKTQSKEAIRSWMNDAIDIHDALQQFRDYLGDLDGKKDTLWANGIDFDFPMLRASFKACKMPFPWQFWMQSDARTVFKMFGLRMSELRKDDTTFHSSKDDAVFQAKTLIECLKPFHEEV